MILVRITAPAERDLEEIGNFIAEDSPVRAASFVLELVERCRGLSEHAERYPVATVWRGRHVRRCPHGNYLIFYSVIGSTVEIDHVVHSARDYIRVLYSDS